MSTIRHVSAHRSFRAYDNYRITAVIDWIELRIVLAKPSNFDTVRKRLGVPYAKPLDKGSGGAATVFDLKIHDPTSWRAIESQLKRLTHDHPLAEPPKVIGIEVAVDAYAKVIDNHTAALLREMAKRFYRYATRMVSTNRRAAGGFKGSAQALATERDLDRALELGLNIYVGDWLSNELQHMYIKITDNGGKPLPLDQHRARTEITLRGRKLPCKTLNDWATFRMENFACYFRYRRLKENLNPFVACGLKGIAQVGENKRRTHPDSRPRFFSSSTIADQRLNDLVYEALRRLGKRMKG